MPMHDYKRTSKFLSSCNMTKKKKKEKIIISVFFPLQLRNSLITGRLKHIPISL